MLTNLSGIKNDSADVSQLLHDEALADLTTFNRPEPTFITTLSHTLYCKKDNAAFHCNFMQT